MAKRARNVTPWLRRGLEALVALIITLILIEPAMADAAWERYKHDFLSMDGRIVDTGNGGISHSEGQGFGMLLAEWHNDQAAFDSLWQWTRRHLARNDRALFAWRFDPAAMPRVSDTNNASDGDIFIAWALQRAAQRWNDPSYAAAAARIREAISHELVHDYAGYRVLLPGRQGFRGEDYVDLNLSYWVLPALQAFAQADPDAGWQRLIDDGVRLLEHGRFGRYRLPTDWLRLHTDGTLEPAPPWPSRFGFDAVRIPLYFAWAGELETPGIAPILAFWNDPSGQSPAAWIDVLSEQRAPYAASRGVLAIRALANGKQSIIVRAPRSGDSYYTASLLMLARAAAQSLVPSRQQPQPQRSYEARARRQ